MNNISWDELKQFGCKTVIHCAGEFEKQSFFDKSRENGIIPNLSPFAIKGREHFKVTRSNGRFELMALSLSEIKHGNFRIIEWQN